MHPRPGAVDSRLALSVASDGRITAIPAIMIPTLASPSDPPARMLVLVIGPLLPARTLRGRSNAPAARFPRHRSPSRAAGNVSRAR